MRTRAVDKTDVVGFRELIRRMLLVGLLALKKKKQRPLYDSNPEGFEEELVARARQAGLSGAEIIQSTSSVQSPEISSSDMSCFWFRA